MEFKIHPAQYPNEMAIRKELARYIKTARNNMMLSFYAVKAICQENYLPNCEASIWVLENKNQNIVMDNFWIACTIFRIRMSLIDDPSGTRKEVFVVPPNITNNYLIIRKKLGTIFLNRRMEMAKSHESVAKEVGGLVWNTVRNVELGDVRLTLKTFLMLASYYGFMIDLKQEL